MFTFEDMRSLRRVEPFTPFRLHRSDGGQIDVLSPEAVLPLRHQAVIGLMELDSQDTGFDRWTVVWYTQIARVEMPGRSPP